MHANTTLVVCFSPVPQIFPEPNPHLLLLREVEWRGEVCEDEFFGSDAVSEGKPIPETMMRPLKKDI